MSDNKILQIKDLVVEVITPSGIIQPVRHLDLDVGKKEIVGIVGESGSGKSMTIKSIMRLHNERKVSIDGSIVYDGKELLALKEKEMLQYRGNEIAMIFQDPMISLNPIKTVGKQVVEMILENENISKEKANKRVLDVFKKVQINPPEQRFNQYPFELSGGMLQRIVIAMSLVCHAKLLLADEPTTALDVSTQAQILKMIKEMQNQEDMAVIVVTHNFGVVAEICEKVAVMYAGRIVESGNVREIFDNPMHPYTKALMQSRISPSMRGKKITTIPGVPPSLHGKMQGCPFAPRCKKATENCFVIQPELVDIDGHKVACSILGGEK